MHWCSKSTRSFMNKNLYQAILQSAKLKNKLLKNLTVRNKRSNVKQRNWCLSLLGKENENYFANLNEKDIKGNKIFLQAVKLPFWSQEQNNFSEKGIISFNWIWCTKMFQVVSNVKNI